MYQKKHNLQWLDKKFLHNSSRSQAISTQLDPSVRVSMLSSETFRRPAGFCRCMNSPPSFKRRPLRTSEKWGRGVRAEADLDLTGIFHWDTMAPYGAQELRKYRPYTLKLPCLLGINDDHHFLNWGTPFSDTVIVESEKGDTGACKLAAS